MITGLAVITDRNEYSRFEPNRSIIRVRIVPIPATGLAESVTVQLTRADGFVLATNMLDFTGSFPKGIITTFDVSGVKDADGFALCTKGAYRLVAKNAGASVISPPASIKLSIITADEMKSTYCRGLSLVSKNVLSPKKQPSLVTGVTIKKVSTESRPGLYILNYKIGTPATLQWNNGVAVELVSGMSNEILPDDKGNYIEVNIDSYELPAVAASEGILLDYEGITDDVLQGEISRAVSTLERLVGTKLEPTRVATTPYFETPEVGEFFDMKATPGVFYRDEVFPNTALVWHVGLPYTYLQKVSKLCGFLGDSQGLEISQGSFKCNVRQGIVEVLPRSSTFSFFVTFFAQLDYWGVREYISDFWRWKGIIGMTTLEPELIKMIGYEAAIPLLTVAGQAARGGYSSESISKDGVSRSTSVSKGLYSSTIDEYKEYLKENKGRITSRYKGINMVTL